MKIKTPVNTEFVTLKTPKIPLKLSNSRKDTALKEMEEAAIRLGADAVVGIDLDYETVGANGGMLMVTASGTAIKF